MLSSDKLLRQKQEREQTSRIDELSKSVQMLRRDLNMIKKVIEKQNEETTNQLRELFAFTRKMEKAYLNGLSNNSLEYDVQYDNSHNEALFDINEPFTYDDV